jgi:DnaJ like chaperone protein
MKYLILIILIGIAIYYAMKWQSPGKKKNFTSGNGGNPYRSDDSSADRSNTDNGPYTRQGTVNPGAGGGTNYAKWIGGGLGWAFGGPIGGILGFMVGSMFGGQGGGQAVYGRTQSGDFNISLLVLTAAVMKADGTVKKSELNYVKQFLVTNFGSQQAAEYIKALGEILKQELNVQEVSAQIGQYMDYSSRLMLIQYLFGIALSDGKHDPSEVELINTIAGFMGIGRKDYESIKAMFIKETDSAYKILEVSPSASDDEVKKAYRELAKKYHPDKVAHLGEEIKKAAEVKFTTLNAAYEAVKQERGMN